MNIPSFFRSAFIYTSSNLINALIPILLLPFLTAYLSKEDYGIVALFQVMVMILLPFVGFSASAAIERGYYENRDFPPYVTNGIYLVGITGGAFLLAALVFNRFLGGLTDFPAEYFWTIPLYCICQNASEIVLSYWRLKNQAVQYGMFRIGRTILEVGLSITLVAVYSKGWIGRMDAMAVSMGLFSILALLVLYKKNLLAGGARKKDIQGIARFGAPLIPHVLGGIIMVYSDRIFITKMVGLAETGSYTVGYQVAMAISLLQSSFNLAWVPWFYSKLNQNDETIKLKIVKFTYLYNVLILMCAIGLTLVAPLIFKVFINKNYNDSIQFVWWVALGFAFDGMYKMKVSYLFYLKKTHIVSVVTFGVAILNLILNYFLIKSFGAIGAAQATAICLFCEYVIIWMVSARMYKMPWLYFMGK